MAAGLLKAEQHGNSTLPNAAFLLLFLLIRGSILWPFDLSYTSYSVPAYPQLVLPCPAGLGSVSCCSLCVCPQCHGPEPAELHPSQAALFQVVINTRALSSAYAGSSLESSHSAVDCQRQKNLHWVSIYTLYFCIFLLYIYIRSLRKSLPCSWCSKHQFSKTL